jgi:pimeloyl-ACP methyl ester carboxylesterase
MMILMTGKIRVRPSDLQGVGQLAVDATAGVTDMVETLHHNIARAVFLVPPDQGPTRGITGLVYLSIRRVNRLVGGGMDAVFRQIVPRLAVESSSEGREAVLAALNGVLGDHLADFGNPLAIPMRLRRDGQPLEPAIPQPGSKLVVLAHGLCMNDLQWNRQGHDHGAALARDLGYTPVYLHYNSGLHISANGRAFADRLEALVRHWPVPLESLVILGHSMGGLVNRSACYYGRLAGHEWPRQLKKLVFLGTPHHGASLERGGNWVDVVLGINPYTAPFARLGKIRSAGITDLRHGNLLDEDWEGRDRFERSEDPRRPVPLPDGVQCYAMAATVGDEAGGLADRYPGDGLVSVESALGRHEEPDLTLQIPEHRRWVIEDTHHFDLLSRPEAYEKIKEWLQEK